MRALRLVRFILTRLLQAIPVVLGVVVLNFMLLQLAPGDAATVLAGEAGGAPPEYIEQFTLRTSGPQSLKIAVGGREIGPIGPAGTLVKNVSLKPADLLARGSEAANTAAPTARPQPKG